MAIMSSEIETGLTSLNLELAMSIVNLEITIMKYNKILLSVYHHPALLKYNARSKKSNKKYCPRVPWKGSD